MSDGDFGGSFDGGFDSGFDGGVDSTPDLSSQDHSADYGPPLEGPDGAIDPPQQMLYVDGMQGPPQGPGGLSSPAAGGQGLNSTGFVASGGASGHSGSTTSAADFLIPAMIMGTMANSSPVAHSGGPLAMNSAAHRQPIGCAPMFFMVLFVGIALAMSGAAFRNGLGLLGVVPIGLALMAVIAIATNGRGTASRGAARFQPANRSQFRDHPTVPRFCVYCGRLAQAREPGCAGCGGPIDGKPRGR